MREQDSWLDAGSQAIDSTPTWQQAGQDALAQDASGQTWQDVGANAANGWLGAGQEALGGGGYLGAYVNAGQQFDATQWGAGARLAASGPMTYDGATGQWYSGPASGGGGGMPGSGAAPSPSTINNPAGGGGGGGGGGSGSTSPTQSQYRPGYTAAGTNNSNSSGLSGILGLASQFLNRQQPQTGAPDLGLNIPGLNLQQNSLPSAQNAGFSFGGLVSGNQGVQQTSQQPQSFNQAAQQSMQSFTGAQKGESGSPFQGGVGSGSSRAGSSGSGFAGSPPTPMQALSQGQPNTQLNAAPSMNGINPAIMGLTGSGLGGSQSPDIAPGMAPITQPGSAPGGAATPSMNGTGGITGQKESGSTGGGMTAAGNSSMLPGGVKTADLGINPDIAGDKPTPVQAKASSKDLGVNPDIPGDAAQAIQPSGATDAARKATAQPGPNEYQGFSVQRDLVEPAGAAIKKYAIDPALQGVDKTLSNIAETVAYPFRTDAQRAETERQLQADELKLARNTSDHPYVAGAFKMAGELVPFMASRVGSIVKEGVKGASVLNNALFGAAVGGTQYAETITGRAVNTAMGTLLGTAGSLLVPAAKVVPKIFSGPAIGGAIGGYGTWSATQGQPLTTRIPATIAGTTGGALLGRKVVKALKGKSAQAATKADDFIPPSVTPFGADVQSPARAMLQKPESPLMFGAKPKVKGANLQEYTVPKVNPGPAIKSLSDNAARIKADKEAWLKANPSYKYVPEGMFDDAPEMKAIQSKLINEAKKDGLKVPKEYGQAHPDAVKWILEHDGDPAIKAETIRLIKEGIIPDPRLKPGIIPKMSPTPDSITAPPPLNQTTSSMNAPPGLLPKIPGVPSAAPPIAPSASSSSIMSKVGSVADAGFKAAAPVATQTVIDARTPQMAQTPSENVNVPPAAPTDLKTLTDQHNKAIMQKLEKSPDAPVSQAVDPQVLQQVQANAEKDPMVKSLHDQIMIMNPTAMANWADSPEGRTNIYQIVKAKGTPEDLIALQKMFQARDEAYAVDPRLKKYSGVDYSGGTPGTPLGAVMDRLSKADQAKAVKEAAKEAGSASKAEIKAAVAQKQVSKTATLEETTIERMAREAQESRARRMRGRGGVAAPVQTKKQKSAFSARLLQLLLSYMMKQPGVQASLNAPGEVGEGSRLLLSQLQTKAYGG